MALVTFAAVLYDFARRRPDETLGLWMRTTACARRRRRKRRSWLRTTFHSGVFGVRRRRASSPTRANRGEPAYFDRHVPSVSSVGATCERVVEQSLPEHPAPRLVGGGDHGHGGLRRHRAAHAGGLDPGEPGADDGHPRHRAPHHRSSAATSPPSTPASAPARARCAKEHDVLRGGSAKRRLHACANRGATAPSSPTAGWSGRCSPEWDLDVAFDELLPCAGAGARRERKRRRERPGR